MDLFLLMSGTFLTMYFFFLEQDKDFLTHLSRSVGLKSPRSV